MNIAVMYHYVREPDEWRGSVPISPKSFEKQLDDLGKKYEFVSPNDLTKNTKKPKCVITFDDATKDQYENAFRIMNKKGIPGYFTVLSGPLEHKEVPIFHLVHAILSHYSEDEVWNELKGNLTHQETSYICSSAKKIYYYESLELRRYIKFALNFFLEEYRVRDFLEDMVYHLYGSKNNFINQMYISTDEFQVISNSGMTIGVHGVGHKPFGVDSLDYFEKEIAPCKKFIEKNLKVCPQWYTPPFGAGNNIDVMKSEITYNLKENGFKGAFTTINGSIDNSPSFWLKRIDCNKLPNIK